MKQTFDAYFEVSLYRVGNSKKIIACASDFPKWLKLEDFGCDDLFVNIDPNEDIKERTRGNLEVHGYFLYDSVEEMKKAYGNNLVFVSNLAKTIGDADLRFLHCDSKDDAEIFFKKNNTSRR